MLQTQDVAMIGNIEVQMHVCFSARNAIQKESFIFTSLIFFQNRGPSHVMYLIISSHAEQVNPPTSL